MTPLVAEIKGSFSSAEEICNPKLGSRSYLSAYIDETLRMNHPQPSMLRREVLKGGLTIDNHCFPKGINVGTPLYVLHHDPTIFPDP
jgi:cytochrome P450